MKRNLASRTDSRRVAGATLAGWLRSVHSLAVLAIGAAAGAGAMTLTRPDVEVAPMTPVAISSVSPINSERARNFCFRYAIISRHSRGFPTLESGMQSNPGTSLTDRSLVALAVLNFFLADARDGLGPFLDGFLATRGWSPMTLGFIATLGGVLGMVATPLFGAWVDASRRKRMLIIIPVMIVTAAALWTLARPGNASVFGGQSATAIVGAVIGPALMGLTLGLVGEREFSRQVSKNEFWNHLGNVVSLAGIYLATMMFGLGGIIGLMIFTSVATVIAVLAIDPQRINHQVARGLAHDDGAPGPSGYSVLVGNKGLILLAVMLMIFHFGNAPISRLVAQDFSIQLGTPFRTTAVITGVSQLSMIAMALAAPFLIRRFGLASVFVIALMALPIRGAIAGSFSSYAAVFPVQVLDGIGAGLIGIATPIAAERILSGTGRFNVGLAAVMTVQGIGASLSNVVAGWLTGIGGYSLAYWVHGGVAAVALAVFLISRKSIAPTAKPDKQAPNLTHAAVDLRLNP